WWTRTPRTSGSACRPRSCRSGSSRSGCGRRCRSPPRLARLRPGGGSRPLGRDRPFAPRAGAAAAGLFCR
ncbi:unnamed protein product, partial [Prorocentrum cordatum]